MKRSNTKHPSVGTRIVQRLQDFAETLEQQVDLPERFTRRVVKLAIEASSYTPKQVKAVREDFAVSQAVFASFLGVSVKTVRSWEQGQSTPSTMACRFLDEIRANPEYWDTRLKQLLVVE